MKPQIRYNIAAFNTIRTAAAPMVNNAARRVAATANSSSPAGGYVARPVANPRRRAYARVYALGAARKTDPRTNALVRALHSTKGV